MWQFGPYRVEERIAGGGMGEVMRAYDTRHDRVVALKLLHTHLAADESFRERFKREAHAVAKLREPHVIPIHAYGEIDGRLYLDMRLVDGEDVAALLARVGALAPPQALALLGQVADALDAAHAEGLVHRDVKPSNVLVSGSGFAYLVDFGITFSVNSPDPGLTGTGAAVGTLDYMSPERFSGGAVDARSDVYSLACVLYQCVTGEKPFGGRDQLALIGAHLHQPPPRPSDRGVYGLDEVIARGMAKNPAERLSSAGALIGAARAALAGHPAPVPVATAVAPQPPPAGDHGLEPQRQRKPWVPWVYAAVAVLLVAAVVGGILWIIWPRPDPQATASASGGQQATTAATAKPPTPSTVTRTVPQTVERTVEAPPADTEDEQPASNSADLGLAVPMSVPACDGSYVVIAGSSIEPHDYVSEISDYLDSFPGSSYLHTPTVGCGSLRHQVSGADVYSVYYGPYSTLEQACAKRAAVGGDAYVKSLDNVTGPSYIQSCG